MKLFIRNTENHTEISDHKATEVDIKWVLNGREIRVVVHREGLIELQDGEESFAIESLGTRDACLLVTPPVGVEHEGQYLKLKLNP